MKRRELTDAERIVTRLEFGDVVLRQRGEKWFVRGRCLSVGGRGALDEPGGVLYVLLEVRADAKVEVPSRRAEVLSEAELEEMRAAVRGLIPDPAPTEKPS